MFSVAIVLLLCVMLIVWLWQNHLRAKEVAVASVKVLCKESNVQLLDQTVALSSLRIRRQETGGLAIFRTFIFDYSRTDGGRFQGQVSVCGHEVFECGLFAQGEQKAKARTAEFSSKDNKHSDDNKPQKDNVVDIQEWVKGKKSKNDD